MRLFFVGFQSGDASGPGDWVTEVGVGMEKFDLILGPDHQCVVHFSGRKDRAHWNGAVRHALGGGDEIGNDAEMVGREWCVQPAKTGDDDLVEDQENAMLVGNRAQAVLVSLGRQVDACRSGDRLDDCSFTREKREGSFFPGDSR
jgi:hypothetical protein